MLGLKYAIVERTDLSLCIYSSFAPKNTAYLQKDRTPTCVFIFSELNERRVEVDQLQASLDQLQDISSYNGLKEENAMLRKE